VRNDLRELRASNNLASVTPVAVDDAGVLCIVVPIAPGATVGDWAQPTEPFLLMMPAPVN
jgi:hypothetical protein